MVRRKESPIGEIVDVDGLPNVLPTDIDAGVRAQVIGAHPGRDAGRSDGPVDAVGCEETVLDGDIGSLDGPDEGVIRGAMLLQFALHIVRDAFYKRIGAVHHDAPDEVPVFRRRLVRDGGEDASAKCQAGGVDGPGHRFGDAVVVPDDGRCFLDAAVFIGHQHLLLRDAVVLVLALADIDAAGVVFQPDEAAAGERAAQRRLPLFESALQAVHLIGLQG